MPNRTLVIAEPGCVHEGKWERMVRLFEVARSAGADILKPQYVSNPAKMCERRHIGPDHPQRSYYETAYGWNSYPLKWLEWLSEACKATGMQLACTSFLPEDVWAVDPFVSIHKVASFERGDQRLSRTAWATGKRVLISQGMSDGAERWIPEDNAYALLCRTAYPAPLKSLRLKELRSFGGLSDHSRDVRVGGWAVMAGATVVEAHIRLADTSPDNPDYAAALSPSEFTEYVRNVRDAEEAYDSDVKGVQPCEEWALPYRVTG
jgi:sialic acid synthase SpsE